jgi:hypothetical protein
MSPVYNVIFSHVICHDTTPTCSKASWNISKSFIHSTAKVWSTMSVLFSTTIKGSLVLYRILDGMREERGWEYDNEPPLRRLDRGREGGKSLKLCICFRGSTLPPKACP